MIKQSEHLRYMWINRHLVTIYCPKTIDDGTIKKIAKDIVAIPMILFLAWAICFCLDLIVNGVGK
jgi:hypothetical protein